MLTDDDIDTALSDVLPLEESLEDYPGTWQSAPYADHTEHAEHHGHAVLGLGDGSWDVLLDRVTGRLQGVPADADAFLLNTSLERFVRCVQAAVAARDETKRHQAEDGTTDTTPDDEADADDEIAEIGQRLATRLTEIDPEAVADDDMFWSVLAEELGYGA